MHLKLRMLLLLLVRHKTSVRCEVVRRHMLSVLPTRNEGIKFVDPVEMTSQETPDSPFIAVTFSDDVDRSTSRVSYRNAAHNIAYKRLRWLSVCNVYK